jgi:diaminopimelate epimerase
MNAAAKTIHFTKASACGNDFLIVDWEPMYLDLAELSRRLCDRHNGIGADGVEWLFPDPTADVMARLFNSDGSEAEVSGNGTRCVAAELCSRSSKSQFAIRTGAGLKTCRVINRRDPTFEFEADMGQPMVGEQSTIDSNSVRAMGMRISMGNPHFVIFVEAFPDDWQRQAALIQSQSQFPQGVNVEYVIPRALHEIDIRLFERGVGETQSSGTGSCASAVAAITSGRGVSPVTVVAPGGPQTVRWENHVFLQGPATLVCRGEFFI